jgi:hypothetical protein
LPGARGHGHVEETFSKRVDDRGSTRGHGRQPVTYRAGGRRQVLLGSRRYRAAQKITYYEGRATYRGKPELAASAQHELLAQREAV